MEKEKKQKWLNISLWTLLAVVVLFVIITTCIIKVKQERLDDLTNKNDQLEDIVGSNEDENEEILKIF